MKWRLTDACGNIAEWMPRWRSANAAWFGGHPLLDERFTHPLVSHFARPGLLLAECVKDGESIVFLLLEQKSPVRWMAFLPSQACIGSNMFKPGLSDAEIRDSLSCLFSTLPGIPLIVDLPKQDPLVAPALVAAHGAVSSRVAGTTCAVQLRGSFAEYWAARPKRLRQRMPGVERRLRNVNKSFSFEKHTAVCDMVGAVRRHGRLENSGWKGRQGTAMTIESSQGKFYVDVMERFARDGEAAVFTLRCDDRLIASLLTIEHGSFQVVLKTAHDEEFREHSPGRYLDYQLMQHLLSAPSGKSLEMYTNASNIELKWWPQSRDIRHITVFRNEMLRTVRDHANDLRGQFRRKETFEIAARE